MEENKFLVLILVIFLWTLIILSLPTLLNNSPVAMFATHKHKEDMVA